VSDVKFRLPFHGFWLTFWGGDNLLQNHHHGSTSQNYAFDFIKTDEQGKFFKTDGADSQDYFAFGQDILTPAVGKIIEVVDGLRDNRPKDLNSFNYLGNYIMIKHTNDVYSVLGHLKHGSTLVKVGDIVSLGQKLAACGNSGYTTDPHLHFHVQNSDVFAQMDADYQQHDVARGQKVVFDRLILKKPKDDTLKKNYSPVKGDVVGY
jgi:murein DD-endopeptidase MepM/ murein hydrolase activator NlpD